jgi:EpsI family protein
VIAAALTAGILMGVSGVVYRVVAAPPTWIPLDPNVLAAFPLQIGEWTGKEVPLDPDVGDVIDADAYVSRQYSRGGGIEAVSLYLPCGADASKLLQHVPENCYVGSGWTLVDRHPVELSLANGRKLPCSILQFSRGGLDMRRLVVLHFLVVDGEYFTTFNAVAKAKGWRHFARVDYAAQVQIVSSTGSTSVESATKVATDFARDVAPAIEELFVGLQASRTTQLSQGTAHGE